MYAILRMQKIKNRQQLQSAISHNLRTINVPNADPNKQPNNKILLGQDYGTIIARLENKFIKHKIQPRKDSVQAVEFVLTASPDFFKDSETTQKWINENISFLKEEFGNNLLNVVLHLDETTPHFHVIITPITQDGRLSCKDLYGGSAKLSALQTRYANKMKPFNLKRGKEKSTAEHTTIKEFYSLINTLKNLKANQLDEIATLIEKYDAQHRNFKDMFYSLSLELDKNIEQNIRKKYKPKFKKP